MAHECRHGRGVSARQPHPVGDLLRHDSAGLRVVSAGVSLADVVQERADEQQVRSRHLADQIGGLGRRFQQVAVDGPAMHRIVLGGEANRIPFRHEPDKQPSLVERFEDRHRPVSGAEQGHEIVQGLGRPRLPERSALGGQPFQRERGERQIVLRRRPSGADDQHRVGPWICGQGQDHLAVLGDDVLG